MHVFPNPVTNYVKDIECETQSEDVSHSGFRTDNGSINENKMSTFLVHGSTSKR